MSAKTWNAAALAYPAVVALSAAWTRVRYDDDGDGGASPAVAMGGEESRDAKLKSLLGEVHARSCLGGSAA